MSATERIRAMLDERGVEYETCDTTLNGVSATFWHDRDGYPCAAIGGTDDIPDGEVSVQAPVTPEQAIAATLGAGTCHVASSIIDTYEYNRWEYELSCGHTIIWEDSEPPNYCPDCGRRIVDEREDA